ncbi:hypothetical protein M422DRAFT_241417 [Sphaerobolus stellatus SS14]|nr:hypothetical protein M422DRAFT_241417 [Sphaerobolus stellatus SS14]
MCLPVASPRRLDPPPYPLMDPLLNMKAITPSPLLPVTLTADRSTVSSTVSSTSTTMFPIQDGYDNSRPATSTYSSSNRSRVIFHVSEVYPAENNNDVLEPNGGDIILIDSNRSSSHIEISRVASDPTFKVEQATVNVNAQPITLLSSRIHIVGIDGNYEIGNDEDVDSSVAEIIRPSIASSQLSPTEEPLSTIVN